MIKLLNPLNFDQNDFIDKIKPLLEKATKEKEFGETKLRKLTEMWVVPGMSEIEIYCFHTGAEVMGGKDDGKQLSTIELLEFNNLVVSPTELEFNILQIANLLDKLIDISITLDAVTPLLLPMDKKLISTNITSTAIFINGEFKNKDFTVWIYLCDSKYLHYIKKDKFQLL